MSPQRIASRIRREVPLLPDTARLRDAVAGMVEAHVPALPVVGKDGRLLGIFGEREFISALFPGYVAQLRYAGFIPHSLDKALEQRAGCADEPVSKHMNTDHIDVDEDFSDMGLAEIFLHHRVLIIPIVHDGQVTGIITREDFFHALSRRLLELS